MRWVTNTLHLFAVSSAPYVKFHNSLTQQSKTHTYTHAHTLTVLEDTLHVQPVGSARLVVRAALEVIGQLAGAAVVDHPGVG